MVDVVCINVESGVQIIDINMGCLVKKVNCKFVGLVFLQYLDVVKLIFIEVVNVVDVFVILKICIGWVLEYCNCEEIV